MERKKLSLRKLCSLVCFIVVAFFVFIMIRNFMTLGTEENTENLKIFGYRPVVVVSGSMEPAIAVNSISIMEYCNIDEVEVGDIIMYRHPSLGINITHRVIEKCTDGVGNTFLKTKGDANNSADNISITNDMVVGKLTKTYNEAAPYVSFVMLENGEVNTFALLQIIILLAVIITVLGMIVYAIWVLIYSIYLVLAGHNKTKEKIETYKSDLLKQEEILKNVENIGVQKGDSFRVIIAKIVLAKELRAFNESVSDLEKAHNLARFIGGSKYKEKEQ